VVAELKKYMDKTWMPNWHIVIGRNFGSFVTHETRCFLYFYYAEKAVMMFKAG
jgi:dynein light chain LC8-type